MHLTREQIEYLMSFVKKHYVEWYDLQVEMVDHLANDIEQIMRENPHISFEEALEKAFKKFGPMGFMDIAEKKQNALKKKYLLNIIYELRQSLFSYRFIYFTLATVFYYIILTRFPQKTLILSLILLTIIPFLYSIINLLKIRRKKKKGEKIYLVDQVITNSSLLISLIMLNLFNVFNSFFFHGKEIPHKFHFIFSLFFVCCLWGYYFAFITVPQKMERQTHELYEKLKAQA